MTALGIGLGIEADNAAEVADNFVQLLGQIIAAGDLPDGCALELSGVLAIERRASFSVIVRDTIAEPAEVELAAQGLANLFRTLAATAPPGVVVDVADPITVTDTQEDPR